MENSIPSDYVEIIDDNHFIIDMMYAKIENNMTGHPVYTEIGLGNHAYVHQDLWKVLKKIIPYLEDSNLKLKICDAGRPVIAHKMLLEIIPIKGFFALDPIKSQHCHATAIDVCFCTQDGEELVYPTKVDAFEPEIALEAQQGKTEKLTEHLKKARHDYYDEGIEEAIHNREQLKSVMENIGLESILHEWWHYNLPDGKTHPLFEY